MPLRATQQSKPKDEITFLRRHRPDYIITLLMIILVLLGIVVIYSVSPALAEGLSSVTGASTSASASSLDINQVMYRQLGYAALGSIAFLIAAFAPFAFWKRIKNWLLGGAFICCLLIEVLPSSMTISVNGARRWLNLGGFLSFQPSELLKLALLIFMASFLTSRIKAGKVNDRDLTIVPMFLLIGFIAILIAVLQKDLGTMFPLMAIFLTMLYMAGVNKKNMLKIIGGITAAAVALIIMFPHRVSRIFTFLNSGSDLSGTGYQVHQALIAVGSGGIAGQGLGHGVQAFGYLPEAANDSIFAILAEKFGLIGTVVVLLVFALLFVRILQVMERTPNDYLRLVVAGVFGWMFTQTIVNIGAILSILPLTGVPLPFISYGGTSLVFIMTGIGLVINVSRYTTHKLPVKEEEDTDENSGRRRRFGGSRYTGPRGT
jgi:cell division protein FtsW